jgi:hypothetical protein
MINAYKNNYNSNEAKKPTNTLVAIMDLDIHIYE